MSQKCEDHALLGWDQMTDLAIDKYPISLLSICNMKQHPVSLMEYTVSRCSSSCILTHLSAVASTLHTSDSVSTMFDRWCGIFWIMSCFILHISFLPSFWCWLILASSVQRILFQHRSGSIRPLASSVFGTLLWIACIYSHNASVDCRLWQWQTLFLDCCRTAARQYKSVLICDFSGRFDMLPGGTGNRRCWSLTVT